MGTAPRRKLANLIKTVVDDGSRFEFFQALRLFENLWRDRGMVGRGLDRWVRLRPAPEISFPASDIRRVSYRDDGAVEIEANFMGLYGVDAPVPLYLVDMVALGDEPAHRLRAFMDIFNHRLYALFYLAWKKYRAVVQLEQSNSVFRTYVGYISGMTGDDSFIDLRYAGAIAMHGCSAATIAATVSNLLGGVAVEISQFEARWIPLAEPFALSAPHGKGAALGESTVLGDEVLDLSSKIAVEVGPVAPTFAMEMLPGTRMGKAIAALLGRMLGPTGAFDIRIKIDTGTRGLLALGSDSIVLGWSAWIGENSTEPQVIDVPGTSYRSVVRETNDFEPQHERRAAA